MSDFTVFHFQGFVKIARWNDMNFWSVKATVEKTHKTLHKYMKELEEGLNAKVSPYLTANIKDWLTEGGEGVWDKKESHEMQIHNFVASNEHKVCVLFILMTFHTL